MKMKYNLDIQKKSKWKITTPTSVSLKFPFYISEWGHFFANSGFYTSREGQGNFMVKFTLAGEGVLRLQNQEYRLTPRTITVFQCMEPHYYATSDDYWEVKWIHFDGKAAVDFCNLINGDGHRVISLDEEGFQQFNTLFELLSNLTDKNDIYNSVEITSILTRLLALMVQYSLTSSSSERETSHHSRVQSAIDYIETHFTEKITLDELASKAYLSKYHFLRVFKEQTGISPIEYLSGIRISRAKILLKSTDMTLSEISEVTGFCDSKSLIRVFKDKTGETPGRYRKNLS